MLDHLAPGKLEGTALLPLSQLRTEQPHLFERYVRKYEGREDLLDDEIPGLDCRWQDVVYMTAIPPQVIKQLHEEAGFAVPELRWFQINPAQLDPEKLVVYRYLHQEQEHKPAFVGNEFARVEALPGNAIPAPFGADGPQEVMEVTSHDGHAPGHGALWLPDRGVLVAGDMLSDLELPLPFTPEGLSAYLPALDALEPYVTQAQWLIPGHGTPTPRPLQRLQADRFVLEALLRGEDADDRRRLLPEGEETYQRLKETVDAYRSGSRGAPSAEPG